MLVIWTTGLFGMWTGGMGSIANNTNDYSINKSQLVQGEYSLTIDLSNMEGNIGKELYNDGTHMIYVSAVDNTENMNTGGYRIFFRSIGRYSLNGASLISGIHHARTENGFTKDMTAKMTAEYKGRIYDSSVSGISGLNYKDGDDFGFYIFPSEAYEKKEISFEESGAAVITVTNLYKNIWSKE